MGQSIGIDLGTTNTVAAHYDGEVRIFPTWMNRMTTPSVVGCWKSQQEKARGQIQVGWAARNRALMAPRDTIFSIKRLMGRTIDEPEVWEARAWLNYAIVGADDPEDRGVRVLLGGEAYRPTDITTMILRQIKDNAEQWLGEEVTHAVITVPACFEERQRAATREAALNAGFTVKKIVDEPTAAAVAFGIDRQQERHRALVYDMGGGTFDVSLIQMTHNRFQVLAIEGDTWLGGDDFDYKIVQAIIKEMKDWYGSFDLREDERFLVTAKQEAEKAKIQLSRHDTAYLHSTGMALVSGTGPIDLDMMITRDEFNSGEDRVIHYCDGAQLVARGAALLAARLKMAECPDCGTENVEGVTRCGLCSRSLVDAQIKGDISLHEITARSIGTAVHQDGRSGMYRILVPKGTTYPCRDFQNTYYTTASNNISLPIYEGENPIAADNRLQGVVEYSWNQDVPVGTPIVMDIGYDQDRILKASVRILGRPELEVALSIVRNRLWPQRIAEVEWTMLQCKTQNAISTAQYIVEQCSSYVDPATLSQLETNVTRAKRAFAENDEIECENAVTALYKAIEGAGPALTLLAVDRLVSSSNLIHEEARLLKQAQARLISALEEGHEKQAQQLSHALREAIQRILVQIARQPEVGDRTYQGLLRIR
jgi:molecular chaperone DnaK